MTNSEFSVYRFRDREHWKLGVFDHLQMAEDGGLGVTAGFVIQSVAGNGQEDNTSALDISAGNQLYWLRPESGELMRLDEFGPQTVGTLPEAKGATSLAVNQERLWLQTPCGIYSYALRGLHPLRHLRRNREILDMASDGRDGIWWLEGCDLDKASLYHVDRFGCQASQPILLPMPLKQGALAVSCCGRKIVVLDPEIPEAERTNDACKGKKAQWRVIVIDCMDNNKLHVFDNLGTIDANFKPRKLTIDREDKIHLIDAETAWLWTLDFDGILVARHHLQLPKGSLPIAGTVSGELITLATARGIVNLHPAETTGPQDKERESIFISPTLISPDGTPHGWKRADIDVVLPAGTTLQVKCAATRDSNLVSRINEILEDASRSSQDKIQQINQQSSWREKDTVLYAGSDSDGGVIRVRFPLHQIDQTHLWLCCTLYTPPGRKPPSIKALSVYYPNISYLHYLPAVYQQDPASALQLQSFLAIFETLLGDLGTIIDQLPSHIDPDTAPESWLSFLLRWLGLPSPDTLSPPVRRKLLKEAPALLAGRGTYSALQRLLEIITDDNGEVTVEIEDSATGPMPWILQPANRRTVAARLGCDTLIVAQQPPAFRLGVAQLGLKYFPLGKGWVDLQQVLVQQAGELKIRIRSAKAARERIEPIIHIFLPYFVPAHCRYRLEFVSAPRQYWQQRLDVDLRLMDKESSKLGSWTAPGGFHLPVMPMSMQEIVLDRNAHLDSGLHLN